MINKSIGYRISIWISLAVTGVFIIFLLIIYFYNRQLLKENIENRAIGLSSVVNSRVNKDVMTTREVANNLATQVIYYAKNNDAKMLISQVIQKYPFLNAIHINIQPDVPLEYHNYFVIRAADSLQYQQSDTLMYDCLNEEEILQNVRLAKKPGWTEPFRCHKEGKVSVSYYSPIFAVHESDTVFQGEVFCELSLSELNRSINSLKLNGGFAFLVNKSGKYITHPQKEKILNDNLFNVSARVFRSEDVDLEKIIKNNRSGSMVAYPELFNYKKSWVYYTPVNENRWYMIFMLPYSQLFAELYLITLQLLFFSVLGIIAIFFIVTYITNKLVEPLSRVTSQLKQFSSQPGQLSSETSDEIQLVSESLDSLKLWFEKFRSEHNQEAISRNLQKQDLVQASEIQHSIINTGFSSVAHRNEIDMYAVYKPAQVVSGDLFDYFFMDDDNLIFTIGDVSGKGVPAAIFMSIAQTIIKTNSSYKKARNIVNKANKQLCTNNQHQFFLTLFLGVFNVSKGDLFYCNAAHTSTIILKTDGSMVELNESHGLPLGLYPDKDYNDSRITLDKGDTIVLYTDGVTELQNSEKAQFGINRLKHALEPLAGMAPKKMAKQLEKNLEIFQEKAPQYDDICIFIIRYNP